MDKGNSLNMEEDNLCKISIELTSLRVEQGESIYGAIYLRVYKSFLSSMTTLKLHLKGSESVKWKEPSPRLLQTQESPTKHTDIDDDLSVSSKSSCPLNSSTQYKSFKDKIVLFENVEDFTEKLHCYNKREQINGNGELNITESNCMLIEGDYTFPFSFTLPDWIPGSFLYQTNLHSGKIVYYVEAKLKFNSNPEYNVHSDTPYTSKMTSRREFMVCQPSKHMLFNQNFTGENSLSTCCCSRGRCGIVANFVDQELKSTSAVGGGSSDYVSLSYKIDNSNCSLPLTSIYICFTQYITLMCRSSDARAVIHRCIAENRLPGLPAHQISSAQNIHTLELRDRYKQLGGNLHSQCLQPSVTGSLIYCNYEIALNSFFDGQMCRDQLTPELKIPLYILPIQYNSQEIDFQKGDLTPSLPQVATTQRFIVDTKGHHQNKSQTLNIETLDNKKSTISLK